MENQHHVQLQRKDPFGFVDKTLAVVLSVLRTRAFYFKKPSQRGEALIWNSLYARFIENLQSFAWLRTCWKRALADRILHAQCAKIRAPYGYGLTRTMLRSRIVITDSRAPWEKWKSKVLTQGEGSFAVPMKHRVVILNGYLKNRWNRIALKNLLYRRSTTLVKIETFIEHYIASWFGTV